MAALQPRVGAPCNSGLGSPAVVVGGSAVKSVSDQFPAGLKVLVVDDDVTCLRIVEQMLRRCHYHVTTCSKATVALKLLREKKGCFDVVLSDVHMPDIDGFKLLEHVGLEMDLPVIMMSADGSTSAVMKGIRHGACDYLIKPIREEELKNIWQHVVRKKWNGNKEFEQSGSFHDNDQQRRTNDDTEYASLINEETEGLKGSKKRGNNKEEDDSEPDNDDPSSSKKSRVVWSVELHQQFVTAVSQLGLDTAVPKRILELMNVPGLTRENVASHLQKFRLYLKRLSGGGPQQQSGVSNAFCGSVEPNVELGTLGRFDIQALAASGHIPPQTLAALHAEILARPAGNLGLPMEQPALIHASLLGPKLVPIEHGLVFGQPPVKSQPNIFKQFPTSVLPVEDASRFGAWAPNGISTVMLGPNNNVGWSNSQNNNLWVDILQQQKQLPQQQPGLPEPSHSINVQPSCLVVPSQSSSSFQAGSPASVNQNCIFNRNSVIDYSILSPVSSNSALNGMSNGDNKSTVTLCGISAPGSSSTLISCSLSGDKIVSCRNPTLPVSDATLLPGYVSNIASVQASYGAKSGEMLDQGPFRNLGYVGKGTFVSSRFAIDEYSSLTSNLNHRKLHCENGAIPVKHEPNMELIMDNEAPTLLQFPSNDLMSVFTK